MAVPKQQRILSFDCANKSLAFSYLQASVTWEKTTNFVSIEDLNLSYCNAVDLLPFQQVRETNIIERTIALYEYLDQLAGKIPIDEIDVILVEFQMGPNDKSRTVADQIILFYISRGLRNFFVVRPSYKNEIHITEGGEFWRFLEKTQDPYPARKKHAKFNFIACCKNRNIDISHIKEKWKEDTGDSFMQAIAYLSGIVNIPEPCTKPKPKAKPKAKPSKIIKDPFQ